MSKTVSSQELECVSVLQSSTTYQHHDNDLSLTLICSTHTYFMMYKNPNNKGILAFLP